MQVGRKCGNPQCTVWCRSRDFTEFTHWFDSLRVCTTEQSLDWNAVCGRNPPPRIYTDQVAHLLVHQYLKHTVSSHHIILAQG